MRLPRLFRTSSFRMTVLYAGVFAGSSLAMLGTVSWLADDYMARQIDSTVANELAEVQAEASADTVASLRTVVADMARRSPGIYYLLQDEDGRAVAGNMREVRARPGLRVVRGQSLAGDPAGGGVRGQGVMLADGGYLFVGVSNFELGEMHVVLAHSMLWGGVLILALAIGGGVAVSLGVLRRIETISRTSRAIMAGDLGRRIPLRGSLDEFDHLAASLNAMLDRIQALMAGLQQVSSDIAHDLRTPLTRLRQRLELARRRETSAEGLHATLDAATDDVQAILDTFAALLRIAQIEAGGRRAGFSTVALTELLEDLVDIYQPVAEEAGQVLTARAEPGLALRGDKELLTQLFANLFENAITHAGQGAAITVTAMADGARLVVRVSDTGPGIPPAFREEVFRRFYRLESSRTTPGNGLGLSLVQAVAGIHGGEVVLQNTSADMLRPGLEVVLRLPKAMS